MNMRDYNQFFHKELISTVIKCSLLSGVTFLTVNWLLNYIQPQNNDQRKNARKKAVQKLEVLGKNKMKLTEYELLIASNLIVPGDLDVSWEDIAGLEDIIQEIKETVIFPILQYKYFSNSKLTRPPKGVLLHGPPGCGKTLIAKATAKQAAATFINLDISMLTDKWYGESQKLVSAVFSLAEKLQPSIIFIDEIDSILRARSSNDHEATAMMKAQFMLLWDGLVTDPNKIVIVMGATNMIQDIDTAILRRMPASFKISLPNSVQRKQILKLILQGETTEELNYDYLADKTLHFSGSDLKELCRIASLYRIREFAKKAGSAADSNFPFGTSDSCNLRPIKMADLDRALDNFGSKI